MVTFAFLSLGIEHVAEAAGHLANALKGPNHVSALVARFADIRRNFAFVNI